MHTVTFPQPDDWHSHLRDNDFLKRTVTDTNQYFNRVIVMPNLKPPICSVNEAEHYLKQIQSHQPTFTPLMTLYLADSINPDEIHKAKDSGVITACKLYPKGATTNSQAGVSDIKQIYPLIDAMQTCQLPLLIHGEIPDDQCDIFEREAEFIEKILSPLVKDFPNLKIVLEHISTKTAVDFVTAAPDNVGATITAHHLLLNRNDLLAGGIKPHNYCLPIVKHENDRQALVEAATSGQPKFFLGTDSAPHTLQSKQSACGCAGIYTAFHAIPLYLETFEKAGALDQFEKFASRNGAQFYGLPVNKKTVTYVKKPWKIPEGLSFGNDTVVPLLASNTLQWQLMND